MSQITAQLMQLPHGKDLPPPSYETAEAAGMDLRLDDIKRTRKLLGTFDRFFHGQRGMTGGDADTVFREQFLGLVFVNVHVEASSFA